MKILAYGSYGHYNMGDEAILGGLGEVLSDCQVTRIAIVDAVDEANHICDRNPYSWDEYVCLATGSSRLSRKLSFYFSLARLVGRKDIFIIGGGGLLNDCYRFTMLHFFCVSLIVRMKRGTLILCGVSVGPIRHYLSQLLLQQIAKMAKISFARDEASKKKLIDAGARAVEIGPDLAEYNPLLTEKRGLESRVSERSRKRCGVNVVPFFKEGLWYGENSELYARYMTFMRLLVERAENEGFDVSLFTIDLKRDHAAAVDLNWQLKTRKKIYRATNVSELASTVNDYDVVVATRLHACIVSYVVGTPVVAIPYQEKVSSYCATVGLQATVDLETLLEDFEAVEEVMQLIRRAGPPPDSVARTRDLPFEQLFASEV